MPSISSPTASAAISGRYTLKAPPDKVITDGYRIDKLVKRAPHVEATPHGVQAVTQARKKELHALAAVDRTRRAMDAFIRADEALFLATRANAPRDVLAPREHAYKNARAVAKAQVGQLWEAWNAHRDAEHSLYEAAGLKVPPFPDTPEGIKNDRCANALWKRTLAREKHPDRRFTRTDEQAFWKAPGMRSDPHELAAVQRHSASLTASKWDLMADKARDQAVQNANALDAQPVESLPDAFGD